MVTFHGQEKRGKKRDVTSPGSESQALNTPIMEQWSSSGAPLEQTVPVTPGGRKKGKGERERSKARAAWEMSHG